MESLQERIAKRAYELFLARGGQHGYHIQDWDQAEKEIKEEQRFSKTKEQPEKVKKEPAPAKKQEATATEAPKPKRTRASTATPAKKKVAKKKAE